MRTWIQGKPADQVPAPTLGGPSGPPNFMRVLLTGASGQLGAYLLRHLAQQDCDVVAWSGRGRGELFGAPLRPVELADVAQIRTAFQEARPDVVLHTAAMSAIADCFAKPDDAHAVNAVATCKLAELAERSGARLAYISTDLVFDGETSPCREETAPKPLSVYGRSKRAGEPVVIDAGGLVVRVSLLYGPSLIDRPTFFDQQLQAMRSGQPVRLFEDEWRTPLDLPTAAAGIWKAAQADVTGLLHLGGPERMSRLEMGQRFAALAGLDPALALASSRTSVGGPEPRPRDTALANERFAATFPDFAWPAFDDAVRGLLY